MRKMVLSKPETKCNLELQLDAVTSLNAIERGRYPALDANGASHESVDNAEFIVPLQSMNHASCQTPTFSPVAPLQTPAVLTFAHLRVITRTKPRKVLLDDVSGSITGGFWSIMGASGSGKTTLLSTLSLRLDANYMDITGEFRLNGREYSRHVLKAMSAYVMQDDLLHAELTVWETLKYAAMLRMPSGTTAKQRWDRIEEVIELMGISHCSKVIIGNTRRKGISGGERKRVSVAMELLNKPKLIFLDEPTSGLDSSTALTVCNALRNLTIVGECTVVCTIHQPQPAIFFLFDNLILMKKGQIIYQGSVQKVDSFLLHLGFPCPSDCNIADHLLDVISPTRTDADGALEEKKMTPPVNLSLGQEKGLSMNNSTRSWISQFAILFGRNYYQYIRNPDIIFMTIMVTILLAVFIGSGIWFQIGHGQESIPKRVPSIFFACVTQGIVGSFQAVNSFPSERAIMLRERQAGAYQVSAYFAAKSAMDMLAQFWPPMLFSLIVYFLVGYEKTAQQFFIFMMFMMLDCLAATSLATTVSCICVSIELSTVVLALLFEICRLFGGFFASPDLMQEYPGWSFADAFSYLKYCFVGAALNELQGQQYSCAAGIICKITTGDQIIVASGYDSYTIGYCAGILVVFIVGCRLLAYASLRFIKT